MPKRATEEISETKQKIKEGGSYFAKPKDQLEFIPTGSKMLDLALGGGWAENRMANIIGDKSTGKTLLCIEAAANFARKYENGVIKYRESEAAFDPAYAEALGMPVDRVDFGEDLTFNTVEDFYNDLQKTCKEAKHPTLYIVDSLDALSDDAEMKREIDQGSFGASKAKQLSTLFRKLVRDVEESQVTLLIVSQIRDKIGVTFGRKWERSGGKAMDFYASQVVVLANTGKIAKTVQGIKRSVGIQIKAMCDKNKVALPFREAEFQITFGYGIEDTLSCLKWLKEVKALDQIEGFKNTATDAELSKFAKGLMEGDRAAYRKQMKKIHRICSTEWYEIENSFLPKQSKYGD